MNTQILNQNLENREKVIQSIAEELMGPSTAGDEIDCSGEIHFEKEDDFYKPYKQAGSGEEIIQRHNPSLRYGVGVLYPVGWEINEQDIMGIKQEDENESGALTPQAAEDISKIEKRYEIKPAQLDDYEEDETGEFDMSTANSYHPASLAVSFRAEFPKHSEVRVIVTGGRYQKKKVYVEGRERIWWLRQPVEFTAVCPGEDLSGVPHTVKKIAEVIHSKNTEGLNLQVEILSRPQKDGTRLITVSLVNRTPIEDRASVDEYCLFQSHFKLTVHTKKGTSHILPYPEPGNEILEGMDMEEQSLSLLYRKVKTFAIGHGCAANWDKTPDNDRVCWVSAEVIPVYEAPSMTPDICRKDGTPVEVSMETLAGLKPDCDGFSQLEEIINLYREWIEEKREGIKELPHQYHAVANYNLTECEKCADSMKEGLEYLKTNDKAKLAFQLANHAILLQQISGQQSPREGVIDQDNHRIIFSSPFERPDVSRLKPGRGKWRAFQIAFLLMSLRSSVEPDVYDRENVELIWFPTGGGKTEAYLALAAFTMFMRRLTNPDDAGVSVLMRYTLRLLTADQFQRASKLICSMEYLRRKYTEKLGNTPFTIGIWVGGATTPNKRKEAAESLRKLINNKSEDNPFVLRSCPWCSAKLGRYKIKQSGRRKANQQRKKLKLNDFKGYENSAGTVIIKCPDQQCDFHKQIPVYVIDEDIYDVRPSLIIGTVDKFAMLAWKPEARALFGIGKNGERFASPPGLIIQDELHLISGPLGSMTGLFETLVEELCTDKRYEKPIKPKIVCSTATIRRYRQQIRALYARENVTLFPSPGIEIEDSFFSRYAKDENGQLMPGRKYLGLNAPGLGSMQTLQVRSFTSILQAPLQFPDGEERDPWWTFLVFFNSLRELGTTLTLLQSDIPYYIGTVRKRKGLNTSDVRYIHRIKELTSRLTGEEVSAAIDELKTGVGRGDVVDICLASNIIEVGVDIDRLSIMAVVGQPKTTSQYIQVTGRIGRRWHERPGLVAMLYNASKPRDRSHYEKFRSYHERLYSYVEPSSVTPFSAPAVDRALHTLMVAYVRQTGDLSKVNSPYPLPSEMLESLKQIVLDRVKIVDKEELDNVRKVFEHRIKEWETWQPVEWENDNSGNVPLLRIAGEYASERKKRRSWATPMSMRNVDAQCQIIISDAYSLSRMEE